MQVQQARLFLYLEATICSTAHPPCAAGGLWIPLKPLRPSTVPRHNQSQVSLNMMPIDQSSYSTMPMGTKFGTTPLASLGLIFTRTKCASFMRPHNAIVACSGVTATAATDPTISVPWTQQLVSHAAAAKLIQQERCWWRISICKPSRLGSP